jgi:epoxyqueuosine reductase
MGFDAVGFAARRLPRRRGADLAEYIGRGYHGDMGWLAHTMERTCDPRALWAEARSVSCSGSIMAATIRLPPRPIPKPASSRSMHAGRIITDTVKKRLKALARWIAERWPGELKVFVDTAPVMEKPLAQQAGIGWQGKHTNSCRANTAPGCFSARSI